MDQIVEKYKIRVSKGGRYCALDIAEKIVKSTNPKKYVDNIKEKNKIGDNYYIDKEVAVAIIKKSRSDECKEAIKLLGVDDDKTVDKNMTEIDTFKNRFMYEGTEMKVLYIDGSYWFRGKDIAFILGYKNTNKALDNNIDDDDKAHFKKLNSDRGCSRNAPLTGNQTEQPETVYINESGFYSLILLSKKKDAKKFRKWVTSEVLPNIRKTGTYKSSIADITKIPALAYTIRKTLNTSWLYIIKIAKNTYKFGITMDIKRRLSEHGPTKNPSEVVKTYDLPNMNICKRLETFIKKLSKDLEIDASDKFSAEHFETNEDYSIDTILGLIEQQIENELKIYNDENNLDFSAQDKADIKKLECQIELKKVEATIQKMKLDELKLSLGIKLENDNKIIHTDNIVEIAPEKIKKRIGNTECKDCGKPAWNRCKFCQFCYGKHRILDSMKNGRPPYSQLKSELEASSYVKLGKKYNVSDVCIKKWLNMYEKYGLQHI